MSQQKGLTEEGCWNQKGKRCVFEGAHDVPHQEGGLSLNVCSRPGDMRAREQAIFARKVSDRMIITMTSVLAEGGEELA